MKLIILSVLCSGIVSSQVIKAPYLPSGWRPKGPAFDLPTETEKPTPISKSITTELPPEYESEGSSFLREYGPPNIVQDSTANKGDSSTDSVPDLKQIKEESNTTVKGLDKQVEDLLTEDILQDLTVQALPDFEPNLSFRTIAKYSKDEASIEREIDEHKMLDVNYETNKTEIGLDNFELINHKDAELNEYIEIVQGNDNQLIDINKTIDTKNTSKVETENFEVLLVNPKNEELNEKEESETNDEQGKSITNETDSSEQLTPVGFQEYGPPIESRLPTRSDEAVFQGPGGLTAFGQKRNARNIQRRRRSWRRFQQF